MKLFEQQNNFDCGICSLMMLLDYYKIENVSREDLYRNVYIEKNGISVMELELLAHKYGIFLESYEATLSEIYNDKSIKEPFILVTNENDNLHYVVGVKKDKYIKILDPKGTIKKVTSETPLENYLDIFIKSQKLPENLKYQKFIKNKKLNFINHKYISFNIIINLLLLSINFFTSFITSQLLNKIGLLDLSTLLAISFGLIIFYVVNSLLEFLVFLLSYKILNKIYLININSLINAYIFKLPGFYKTIDRNIFNNGHSVLKNNIFFVNEFICNCIISSIFVFISFVIIFLINIKFLFFVFLNIFIILLIGFFEHKYTNQLTKISIEKNNKIQDLAIKINQFNISNFSYKLNNIFFYKFKNNIKESEHLAYKINKKKIWTEIIKNLWTSIFYLMIIAYYIFINKQNKIGNLFFCLQVISTLNKYSIDLIDSISDAINFKVIKEMLSNLYNINNLIKTENNEVLNLRIEKPILIKKTNFEFSKDIKNKKFKIGGLQVSQINHFNDICHYIKFETLTDLVMELLNKEWKFDNSEIQKSYNEFIRNKIVNDENIYCQLDYLILYLFYLSTQKEQIIIIDSNLELNNNNKNYLLVKQLLEQNKENNMIIFINSSIIKYFEHQEIELENEEDL